ncbi:MAG: hypothetical protein ACJARF_001074 [Alteromonadaceae bacterium]|jgi:hypothetical protein
MSLDYYIQKSDRRFPLIPNEEMVASEVKKETLIIAMLIAIFAGVIASIFGLVESSRSSEINLWRGGFVGASTAITMFLFTLLWLRKTGRKLLSREALGSMYPLMVSQLDQVVSDSSIAREKMKECYLTHGFIPRFYASEVLDYIRYVAPNKKYLELYKKLK